MSDDAAIGCAVLMVAFIIGTVVVLFGGLLVLLGWDGTIEGL